VSAKGPRVVAVGANLESAVALQGLLAIGANVVGLVTVPPQAPGGISDYVDLHALCAAHGVAAIDTEDINGPETLAEIAGLSPDYIFTLGWSQLFGVELLKIPARFVLGSHPSPLPEGRGRAPVPWTILQGHTRSAVTIFRMDAGVDAGAILCQRWFDVPPRAYAMDVYNLVAENLRDGYCGLYQAFAAGREVPETAQDTSRATHRAKRGPAEGHLDFNRPAAELDALIRAVSQPYPGAYTYFDARKVEIWRASLENVPPYTGVPGQILAKRQGRLLVQAGDAPLWLSEFTSDGETLTAKAFPLGSAFGFRIEDELFRLRQEVENLSQIVTSHGRAN
jgi:methionyl-tRNA formyltransferase